MDPRRLERIRKRKADDDDEMLFFILPALYLHLTQTEKNKRHSSILYGKKRVRELLDGHVKNCLTAFRMLKDARMQSGVGWNQNEFKLQAEPHLWNNLEISFGPRIKRFKIKSFPLYDSLGQLYEGNIAEGKYNFTSTSAPSEDVTLIESGDDESEKENEREVVAEEDGDDMEIMDGANLAPSTTQVQREEVNGRKTAGGPRKKPKTSPKKKNAAGLVQVMERLVNIKEMEVNKEAAQDFTISRCMDAFKTLEGASVDDKIPALEVFKVAENREIFVNLAADKDGTAIKWLRAQIAKLT